IKTLIWSIIVGGAATVGIPYLLLSSTGASLSLRLPGLRLFGLALILFGAMIYAWSASTFTFIGKLIIYAILALLFFHFWIVFYAEPVLRRRFGKSYEVYCASVSRWFPRLPKTQR